MEAEIEGMQKKLDSKRRPTGKMNFGKVKERFRADTQQDADPERTLSLFDHFSVAIQDRRQFLLDNGLAKDMQSIEERQRHEWWRDRARVDTKALGAAKWAALSGLLGSICAVVQNELVLQELHPRDMWVDGLKAANTGCTMVCMVLIYRYYWLHALIFRITRHCRRMTDLDTHVTIAQIFSGWEIWAEMIVVGGLLFSLYGADSALAMCACHTNM